MLKVEISKDRNKIKQQITALEYQITIDTLEKDKEIHMKALKDLRDAYNVK